MTTLFEKYGKTYQPNEIIFCEYEPGDDFYLIQSGHVKITKVVGDTEKTLDILQQGDIFGEMAILEHQPRSATAIAIDEVKVLNFNRENFELLLKSNPHIALRLLQMFSKRIYEAKRQLMILTLDKAEERVADVFVMLAEKQNISPETATPLLLDITVEDVASLSGTKVEEAQRVLFNFSKQGKLEMAGNQIKIAHINEFYRIVQVKRKLMK